MLELSSLKIICIGDKKFFEELSDSLERYGYLVEIVSDIPEIDGLSAIKSDVILIDPDGKEEFLSLCVKRISGESELDSAALLVFHDDRFECSFSERIDEIISKKVKAELLNEKIRYSIKIRELNMQLEKRAQKLVKAVKYGRYYKKEYLLLKDEHSKNHDFLHNSLKQVSMMVSDKEELEGELKRSEALYKSNFDNFVDLLSGLIESKRQYHKGHSKKVAEISLFIAKSFGLDPEEIKDIEIAARLHELGKISIPDELSMKNPKEYSKSEEDLLVQHTVAGADLLSGFSGFERIEKIIRHLHENVDGTGHPDGLARNKIPVGSRIISASNIYDNLVYRSNYSKSDAFSVIEELIGIRYDSKVVNHLHKYANLNPIMERDRSNEINIYEIKPGMKLASGIYTPLGAKLLPVDSVLSQKDIEKISSYHKLTPLDETVYIKD